jgi:ubiquinone/menaquinone biosynthesis C-methylase UbiE
MGEPDKREVADSYDTLGGRIYDLRYTEEQRAKYEALLERMTPKPDDLALDLGCGTGLLTERLESHAVGLDISASLLSTALSRLQGRARSHLVMGDVGVLPFRDSSFDKVFSVTVLQNTPDPLASIIEMKRVSREKAGVTVLKKAFTKKIFKTLLGKGRFSSFDILDSTGLNDWIAFIDL